MISFPMSYESRKYGKPSGALGRSNGSLTKAPDALSKRKEQGQHKADPHAQTPMPRGYCCSGSHN